MINYKSNYNAIISLKNIFSFNNKELRIKTKTIYVYWGRETILKSIIFNPE